VIHFTIYERRAGEAMIIHVTMACILFLGLNHLFYAIISLIRELLYYMVGSDIPCAPSVYAIFMMGLDIGQVGQEYSQKVGSDKQRLLYL
jgi:hypothetical protein